MSQGRELLKRAREPSLILHEIKEGDVSGYLFSLQDKAPPAGEYEFLTQGMLRVGGLRVTFTILSRAREASERAAALEMLRKARHRLTM